ncbi:MAG: hypothetical protein KF816_15965 [Melioribacteraceae bacterium]|nr:hypothetical protein [Melioribacteraceae bacterium]
MESYPAILTLHIIFAGIWLVNFILDFPIRKMIKNTAGSVSQKTYISIYLYLINLLGMIGAIGILVTGISLVLLNPGYNFFQMSANHWLASKQILMVILLIVLGAFLIPTARKLRLGLQANSDNSDTLSAGVYSNLKKLFKLNTIINFIVLINFLFAITHNFIG